MARGEKAGIGVWGDREGASQAQVGSEGKQDQSPPVESPGSYLWGPVCTWHVT